MTGDVDYGCLDIYIVAAQKAHVKVQVLHQRFVRRREARARASRRRCPGHGAVVDHRPQHVDHLGVRRRRACQLENRGQGGAVGLEQDQLGMLEKTLVSSFASRL